MNLPDTKVKQLIKLMNSMSSASIPAQKPIIEMFNIAMDEKMLDYLIALGTDYYDVKGLKEVYEKLYGNNDEGWNKHYRELLNMSFIHPKNNEERHLYSLSPIFPGWVEFYTSGPMDEKRQAVLDKFMEFWGILKKLNIMPVRILTDMKAMKKMKEKVPPRVSTYVNKGKEIILNKPLESIQEIHPKGDIYDLLEKNKNEIAVMNCFCRTYKKIHKNEDCDFALPIEGCITLGALSQQVVENGVAKHLKFEEAIQLLNEFSKKGAIHTTYHYHNDANYDEIVVCNCCLDCCLLYSGYKEGGLSKIFARCYYKPSILNESKCIGCNLCGKHCPTEATDFDRKTGKLIFNYDNCIGCGQCVTQCKFNVREMVEDRRDVFVKTKKRGSL